MSVADLVAELHTRPEMGVAFDDPGKRMKPGRRTMTEAVFKALPWEERAARMGWTKGARRFRAWAISRRRRQLLLRDALQQR